jgi:hypothetical protein
MTFSEGYGGPGAVPVVQELPRKKDSSSTLLWIIVIVCFVIMMSAMSGSRQKVTAKVADPPAQQALKQQPAAPSTLPSPPSSTEQPDPDLDDYSMHDNDVDLGDDDTDDTTDEKHDEVATAIAAVEKPVTPNPLAPSKKRYKLTRGYVALQRVIKSLMTSTRKTIESIPVAQRSVDERVVMAAYTYVQSPTRLDQTSLVALIDTLLREKLWTHVTYLLTVLANNESHIRLIGRVLHDNRHISYRDQSSIRPDLLFATLMLLPNDVKYLTSDTDVFVGYKVYANTAQDPASLMLTHFLGACKLEARSALHHNLTEFGSAQYLRYWQLQMLRERFTARQADFDIDDVAQYLARHVRDNCLNTFHQAIGVNYEVLALHTITHMMTVYPKIFYGSDYTLSEITKYYCWIVHRLYTPARAYLPTFMLDPTALPIDMSLLEQFDAQPVQHISNLSYPRSLTYNRVSNQISLIHRTFRHVLTINRPLAPLPSYEQPLNTMCGRFYLGCGLSSLIIRLQFCNAYAFKPGVNSGPLEVDQADDLEADMLKRAGLTQPSKLPNRTHDRKRIYFVPYVHERMAFEAYARTANTIPEWCPGYYLRGMTVIDTQHSSQISYLQSQIIQKPFRLAVANYNGWLLHLVGAFLHSNIHPYGYREFLDQVHSLPDGELEPMQSAAKFFELAKCVYSYAVNQTKQSFYTVASHERTERRLFRKDINVESEKTAVTQKSAQPYHSTPEGWWYSGLRSFCDEPIDFNSTEDVIDRSVSRAEETLWSLLNAHVGEIDRELQELVISNPAILLGTVLRRRLRGMIWLGFLAIREHKLEHLFAGVSTRTFERLPEKNLALALLQKYVGSPACLLGKSMLEANTSHTRLPSTAVIYERRVYRQGSSGRQHKPSTALMLSKVHVTVSVDHTNTKTSPVHASFVLEAARNTSPSLLANNDSDLGYAMLSLSQIPQGGHPDEPLSLHLWFQSLDEPEPAEDTINDTAKLRNLVTIRVPNDRVTQDFKLYNLLHDDTQYIVVSQTGLIDAPAVKHRDLQEPAETHQLVNNTRFWYSNNTHPAYLPPGEQRNIVIDKSGRLHTHVAFGDRFTVNDTLRTPSFKLDPTTLNNLVDFEYDVSKLHRSMYSPELKSSPVSNDYANLDSGKDGRP